MSKLPLAFVVLLIAPSLLMMQASADTISGSTYQTGSNLLRGLPVGLLNSNGALAMTSCGSDTGTYNVSYPLCLADGNISTKTSFGPKGTGTSSPFPCGDGVDNFTVFFQFPTPKVIDVSYINMTMTNNVNANTETGCEELLAETSPGPFSATTSADKVFLQAGNLSMSSSQSTAFLDNWNNVSGVLSYGVVLRFADTITGSFAHGWNVFELQAFAKNETIVAFNQSMSEMFPRVSTGYAPNASGVSNFASSTFLTVGTTEDIYVNVPLNVTTGYPEPLSVALGTGTSTNLGYSLAQPDSTGTKTCVTERIKYVTTQYQSVVIKPTGAISNAEAMCAITNPDQLFSSGITPASAYITADLSPWGGSTTALWAIAYAENSYPFQPILDNNLGCHTTNCYQLTDALNALNVTAGSTVQTSGATGGTFIAPIVNNRYSWAGNAIIYIVGQVSSASGDPCNYKLSVQTPSMSNIAPATIVACSTGVAGFKWAAFYIDDVAARQSLANSNGSVSQGNYRPFGTETYFMQLKGGFDPAFGVASGITFGRDGHRAITCDGNWCAANLQQNTITLPANQTNVVLFTVVDINGTPISGATITNTNLSTTQTTNSGGLAWFNNTFDATHYVISKTGFVSQCANYYFVTSGGSTGTDTDGCTYLSAHDANQAGGFYTTLLSTNQAGGGQNGGVSIGGSQVLTFTVDSCQAITSQSTCSGDSGPIPQVNAIVTGATNGTFQTNSQGQFFITGISSSFSGVLTIAMNRTGYQSNTVTVAYPQYPASNSYTLYLQIATVSVTVCPQDITIPATANFTVSFSGNNLQFSFFKQATNGAFLLVGGQSYLLGTSSPIVIPYPIDRNRTINNTDEGAYYLAISTSAGQIISTCAFSISGSAGVFGHPTINPGVISAIQAQIQPVTLNQNTATQANTQSVSYLNQMIDISTASPVLIPNMWWAFIVGLMVAIFSLAMHRRHAG